MVGKNARAVGRTGRNVGLVPVVARRERDVVLHERTRVEEVGRVERRGLREFFAPAGVDADFVAVRVLEFGHHKRAGESRIVADRDFGFPRTALSGVDEHYAVGCRRTVKRRGRRSRQHVHRLDVLRVDVRDALAAGKSVFAVHRAAGDVENRHTVNHVEGVVVARNRLGAAHHHAGGTTDAARAGIDRDAGHLASERIHEVGVLDDVHIFALHALHIIGQGLFRALDTQRRDHHGIERLGAFLHADLDAGARIGGDLDAFVAQIGGHQHVARFDAKHEPARNIGRGAARGAFDQNAHADQRHAVLVGNTARDHVVPAGLFLRPLLREDDLVVADVIPDVGSGENRIENHPDVARRIIDRNAARTVYGLVVVEERIVGMLLDIIHDLVDGRARKMYAAPDLLRGQQLRTEPQHREQQPQPQTGSRRAETFVSKCNK